MFDIEIPRGTGLAKLMEWRDRYEKKEYPEKVVINMFYELFAIEGIWKDIEACFSGKKQFSDYSRAFENMIELKRNYQKQTLNANLLSYLRDDRRAGNTKYSEWKDEINGARSGKNRDVVEIEYSYWFYNQYCVATLSWAACGLLGLDKISAFREVTGDDIEGLRLNNFSDAITYFPQILGIEFEGPQDADGNSVDLNDLLNNQHIKSYPGSFKMLPKLWT